MSDEPGFELLLPFVVCDDHGGKFYADAFTAGFVTGQIMSRCEAAVAFQLTPFTATIRRDLIAQCDLIAMHHGLAMTEDEWTGIDDEDVKAEWAHVTFGSPT